MICKTVITKLPMARRGVELARATFHTKGYMNSFSPMEALEHGVLCFLNLSDLYKPKEERGLVVMNVRQELLNQIRAIEFMTVELNLYLDTHPCDMRALKEYNMYTQQLMT